MKKILKIIGITLVAAVLVLAVSPFLFQSQIKNAVKTFINNNVNAVVEFDDVSLSLLSSFPKAEVTVSNLSITNNKPFEGETLASAKSISFEMPFKELFKNANDEPIVVNTIDVNELLLVIRTDKLGNVNYDISKSTTETQTENDTVTSAEAGFAFDIQNYSLKNSAITYIDETSNTSMYLTEINHTGKGTFSGALSELDTSTESRISFSIDSTMYLTNNTIKLDALIDMDLSQNKYSFKENKGFINALPLEFNGYVQINDDSQFVDITFENPESSFKDFLAIIPNEYAKNIDGVDTQGTFKVNGNIKGEITDTSIPTLDISITSSNASFKYPELPKRVSNITIDAQIKNETGLTKDTYVNINNLTFKIDEDVFKANAALKNITENMLVTAAINGTLNLANIAKVYPVEITEDLKGLLIANLTTSFDMNAVETNAYDRIKTNGQATLSNFTYASKAIVNPIEISEASIDFTPQKVVLKSFSATSGATDFKATGTLNNVIGFLLNSNKLQGNFSLTSTNFKVSDFMTETAAESGTETTAAKTDTPAESLKIPAFLDCTIDARVTNVYYDNLTLNNVAGTLVLQDEKASLKNMTTNVFGGTLELSGTVDTKPKEATFDMSLNAADFNLSSTFSQLPLLQNLAPIAKALEGRLNTNIKIDGILDNEFSPQLNSISGDALAELLGAKVNPQEAAVLNKLTSNLSFIDFSKLDLSQLKTSLSFEDGQVKVKPFDINYNDISITIGGTHSFDRQMNYDLTFNVPAKYLGSEVNQLLGNINNSDVNAITIPVTANVTGTFAQPNIKTDLSSAVGKLTSQLVEIQKQKLLNKGGNELNKLLKGITSNEAKTTENDSTATKATEAKPTVNDAVKSIFGNLIGNKKKQDSTQNN